MPNLADAIDTHSDLSEDAQKKAGKAIAGSMDPKYVDFIKKITALVESKDIDLLDPQTFIDDSVYVTLDDEWKDKANLALVNIAHQTRLCYEFYKSKLTPDSSPQLQTMLMQLWEMKERIESHHDVFKI